MKQRLTLFQPRASEQSRFFDELEALLDELAKANVPPEKVHSVLHNTRCWMALVIVEDTA